MSYDLAVWHTGKRLTDREASELYGRLGGDNLGPIAPHPSIEAFYQELTALHPEIDTIPEDRIDDHDFCPWSIAFNRSPGHVQMSCVWSKAEYVYELITKLAHKHGLALYDLQTGTITYPDSTPLSSA